ncbi:hypothetical protein COO60DRAFT_909204 [Scenedesmus sp. NREL 46B-D3]|nr:hypothetical protein COO60DRAFT_909204 [Scenedesmus sp. NREL 46B-D3]
MPLLPAQDTAAVLVVTVILLHTALLMMINQPARLACAVGCCLAWTCLPAHPKVCCAWNATGCSTCALQRALRVTPAWHCSLQRWTTHSDACTASLRHALRRTRVPVCCIVAVACGPRFYLSCLGSSQTSPHPALLAVGALPRLQCCVSVCHHHHITHSSHSISAV